MNAQYFIGLAAGICFTTAVILGTQPKCARAGETETSTERIVRESQEVTERRMKILADLERMEQERMEILMRSAEHRNTRERTVQCSFGSQLGILSQATCTEQPKLHR